MSRVCRVAEDAKLNEKEESTPTTTQTVTRKLAKVETERDKAIRLSSFENVQVRKTAHLEAFSIHFLQILSLINFPQT